MELPEGAFGNGGPNVSKKENVKEIPFHVGQTALKQIKIIDAFLH